MCGQLKPHIEKCMALIVATQIQRHIQMAREIEYAFLPKDKNTHQVEYKSIEFMSQIYSNIYIMKSQ